MDVLPVKTSKHWIDYDDSVYLADLEVFYTPAINPKKYSGCVSLAEYICRWFPVDIRNAIYIGICHDLKYDSINDEHYE